MKAASLRVEEVTCSDRISQLHEDLLFRILSLIPVSDAMSTSLLSKRWKSLWKLMPTLEYVENSFPNIGFNQFVGRSLQLHEAPLLKTLNLKLMELTNSIDSLIFPSIRSTILEITITFTYYPRYNSIISFPNNLRVFQTLVVLKLLGNFFLSFADSPVCFQSLKSLNLKRVTFNCEESFSKLLSACPVLEDLFIERVCSVGHFSFSISVPTLLRLSFIKEQCCYSKDTAGIEINAPCLNYLKIKDRLGCFNFTEDMPKLVEANVKVNLSKNEKLLKVVTIAEHLSLDLYGLMVFNLADRLISKRLLHLELDFYDNFRLNLLLHLLKDFPNLRALKLNNTHLIYEIKDQPCSVSEPSSVPECLSSNLETFQWIGYAGTHEEIKAAVYILENARCLKNATVSLHSKSMENDLIIMKELKSMSKASTSCKLVVQHFNSS